MEGWKNKVKSLLAAGAISAQALVSPAQGENQLIIENRPWSAIRELKPKPNFAHETFLAAYVRAGHGGIIARKKMERNSGSITRAENQRIISALPENSEVYCTVHNHDGVSSPPSAVDADYFFGSVKLLPNKKVHAAVVDGRGVWFMRATTDEEQYDLYQQKMRPLNRNGLDIVQSAVGKWETSASVKYKDLNQELESEEYRDLRSAFSFTGLYLTRVSLEAAAIDPCGIHALGPKGTK